MKIRCVWEHNGGDSLLYAVDLIGAYTRGASRDAAIQKLPAEISAYLKWRGDVIPGHFEPEVVQEKNSSSMPEYLESKALALKSAQDFFIAVSGDTR